jgi:hypothetical protein
MLEFLDEELTDQERATFRKIVSMHFGSRSEGTPTTDLAKKVRSFIEADSKAAASTDGELEYAD